MKARFSSLVVRVMLVVAVLQWTGCATTSGPAHSLPMAESLAAARTVMLTVHGLSCPLCSNNLSGRLRQVEGVEGADIDLNTGAVTVILAEGHAVTAQSLADAVETAGFTLKELKPLESP
jgi:copper chaperone CopZ